MSHQGWSVLVVEDEFDSQQMVSTVLKHHGVDVQIVNNGIECLETLAHYTPTIVIMDLAMPKMDGWETLVAMRSNMATAHIPVIAITAFHSDEVAKGAEAAGFDAYFRKPISPARFVGELETLLRK